MSLIASAFKERQYRLISCIAMKSLGLMMAKGSVPFGLQRPALLQRKLQKPRQVACPITATASFRPEAASATSNPSPLITPDLRVDSVEGSSAQQALEGYIEKVIYSCRFMTILGVAGSLVGSIICFLKGCVYVMNAFTVHSGGGGGKVVMILIEAIDIYLIGTVMLVFGMGLYELFISNLEIGKTSSTESNLFGFFKLVERPEWLEIRSVNQLKTTLGHVMVTVLLVGLVEKSKKVTIGSATDLLCFAASIFVCSACLYLLSMLHASKRSKHA